MQAARGTSLSPADSAESSSTAARRRHVALFALVAAALYGVDQLTKHLAVAHLTGEPDKPLVGDLLQLHLTRNPGAAFSTGTAFTELLTGVAVVAVGVVLWLSRRLGSSGWAAALGLLLAGVGVYGLLAHFVAGQTRDIGVRMALGARGADVLRGVLAEGIRLAAVGAAAGLLISLAVVRLLQGLLYGVGPHDPAAFLGAPAVLGLVTLAACAVPAWRAARVDPMVALRHE